MDAVRSFVEQVGGQVTIVLRDRPVLRPFAAFMLILDLRQAFWWVGHSPELLSMGA
jgi:hypothetical protein